MKAMTFFKNELSHKIGALTRISGTQMFTPLMGFTLNLNKLITGQVSGINIKKDLFIYFMDVTSNSDLTSWIVHTEDILKKPQTTT